jgi:hypothetical protein
MMVVHLLVSIAFDALISISIALGCILVDGYNSAFVTFSSFMSIYTTCASPNCCSIASSYSDSSMNTKSTNVAFNPSYSLAH